MLDDQSSLRLKLLRFPPIIGVVYIHAYGTLIRYSGGSAGIPVNELNSLTNTIRILISEGIARIAVPLFFLMAGYLFFAAFQWSRRDYFKKIITRLRSLLIPFLFWNVVALTVVALGQAIPAMQPYFTGAGKRIAEYGVFDACNAVLGLKGYPVAYHFWFIRDLMILVVLAPLLGLLVRCGAIPFFGALYIFWVTDTWPMYMPAVAGVLFFSAGALCAIKGQSLFALDRFTAHIFLLYLPMLVADVIWYDAWFNNWIHRTGLIVGVLAALCLTRFIVRLPWLLDTLLTLGGTSFFVYAAHEPLLGIVRLVAFTWVPLDGPYTMLLLYLLIPVAVVSFLVGCHRLLAGTCPQLLSLITGGR